jgi:hypothetical protein
LSRTLFRVMLRLAIDQRLDRLVEAQNRTDKVIRGLGEATDKRIGDLVSAIGNLRRRRHEESKTETTSEAG